MNHAERIAYLKAIDKETISPAQAALVLGGNPYWYNVSAKAGKLTLPHMWAGRNLKIFKEPILRLLEGGHHDGA